MPFGSCSVPLFCLGSAGSWHPEGAALDPSLEGEQVVAWISTHNFILGPYFEYL